MSNDIAEHIRELRAEAEEARSLASSFTHAQTVADLNKYAESLEHEISALEAQCALTAQSSPPFLPRRSFGLIA